MVTFTPLRLDSTGNKHEPASVGSVIDTVYVPVSITLGNLVNKEEDGIAVFAKDMISSVEDNRLTLQADNKLFVKPVVPKDLLSSDKDNVLYLGQDSRLSLSCDSLVTLDANNVLGISDDGKLAVKQREILSDNPGNYLRYGYDQALYLTSSDLISTAFGNLLTVATSDGKLIVKEQLLLSEDDGNYIRYGSDKALHLAGNDLVSLEEGNLLTISTTDGKLKVTTPWDSIESILSNEDCSAEGDSTCNLLSVDSCDRLRFRAVDIVKSDPQQMLEVEDCKLIVRPASFISSDEDSCIGLDTDGKLYMKAVSSDVGNNIVVGSDCGAYMPCNYGTMD